MQGVDVCIRRHLAGTHDYSEPLWLLMTFEIWAERFLDAFPEPSGGPMAAVAEAVQ
jgi:asparagine synthase (glutamine-hydrolysing)